MKYVRSFELDATIPTGFRGFSAQQLAQLESAVVVGCWIVDGGCGPSLHYHDRDQYYFFVDGWTNVQLGRTELTAPNHSLVLIPAGTPHCNWNNTGADETHFEMLVPPPAPGAAISHFVESPDEAPLPDGPAFVAPLADAEFVPSPDGSDVRTAVLSRPDALTEFAVAELPAGGSGPAAGIANSDRLCFVLDGELSAEVALEQHVATANDLVILPAGVPHRIWNASDAPVRYLAITFPPGSGAAASRAAVTISAGAIAAGA